MEHLFCAVFNFLCRMIRLFSGKSNAPLLSSRLWEREEGGIECVGEEQAHWVQASLVLCACKPGIEIKKSHINNNT